MGDVATLLPVAGGLAIFGLVIGYLVAGNRADRMDYRAAVAAARKETDDERAAKERTEQMLDTERAARRRAEDEAAVAARAARHADAQLAALRERVSLLEAQQREHGGGRSG